MRRATAFTSPKHLPEPYGTSIPFLRIRILVVPALPLGFEVRGLRFGGAVVRPRVGQRNVPTALLVAAAVGARGQSTRSRGEKMLNPVSSPTSLVLSVV